MQPELEASQLTQIAYEEHKIKYYVYQGLNRFNGTPIPEGFEAIYIPVDEWGIPDYLQLQRN